MAKQTVIAWKPAEETQQPIRLRLFDDSDGSTVLAVVDANGHKVEDGDLLFVDRTGVHRYVHNSKSKCPLPLDDNMQVVDD